LNDLNIQIKTLTTVDYPQVYKKIAELQKTVDKQSLSIKLEIDSNTKNQLKGIQQQFDGFKTTNSGLLIPNNITAPIKQGTEAIEQQVKAIKNASTESTNYKTAIQQTGTAITDVSDSAVSSLEAMGTSLAAQHIMRILNAIKDAFIECAKAAIQFEDSMVEVQKKTSFTAAGLAELRREILLLSTQIPLDANEIAGIAAAAGQIGIAEEHILSFTKTMAAMGVATNMTSKQASIELARLANIIQMPQDQFEQLGAAISRLGNNFASTESEITAFALRIGSAAQIAGMSEGDIVGISSGLASVGLRAEMAGTAFSKAINRIAVAVGTGNADLENFARVAGMSAQEFQAAWGNDAAQTFMSFITGLSDIERHGQNTVTLMSEIGMTELRMSDSLRRASNAGGMFADAIQMGNAEFERGLALQEEAALKYGTTESQLQLLSNAMNSFKISIGDALTPIINPIVKGLTAIINVAADFADKNKGIVQTIAPLVAVLGTVVAGITAYATALKVIKVIELDKHFAPLIKGFKSLGEPKLQGSAGGMVIYFYAPVGMLPRIS
jgi:TP901 family phage tail tape measure protein